MSIRLLRNSTSGISEPATGRSRRRTARGSAGRHLPVIVALTALLCGGLAMAPSSAMTPDPIDQQTEVAARAGLRHILPANNSLSWNCQTRGNHSPKYAVDMTHGGSTAGRWAVASAAGKVTVSKDLTSSYGRYVVVRHSDGTSTLYAHLRVRSVSVGQSVSAGQKVGEIGSTGGSSGPHLHYEQRNGSGTAVPIKFYGKSLRYGSGTINQVCPVK